MSKTIKQIADSENVTKHAIKERMDNIPDFDKKYVNHNGVYKGRKCILVSSEGVKILQQKGYTYRAINHGKSNTYSHSATTPSNDDIQVYKQRAERTKHLLEEVKTGRKMLQSRLNLAKKIIEESKGSLEDTKTDRDHWRNMASSAQSQIAVNDSKDAELKKLALQNQAHSYEAKLKALPSNDVDTLKKQLEEYKSANAKLKARQATKKHGLFSWLKI